MTRQILKLLFNGIKIERKTIINKKNANTTITVANIKVSPHLTFLDISILMTLCPEISVLNPYLSCASLL